MTRKLSKVASARLRVSRDGSGIERKPKRPSTPTPWMSLEERLRYVHHNLVLIMAASQGVDGAEAADVMDAIHTCAEDIVSLLKPFDQAPASIANWRPADEERRARSGGAR